jgi:hypothetical protein
MKAETPETKRERSCRAGFGFAALNPAALPSHEGSCILRDDLHPAASMHK